MLGTVIAVEWYTSMIPNFVYGLNNIITMKVIEKYIL